MSKKSQIKASNDEAEAITSEQFHDMFCGQAKHQSSVVTRLASSRAKDCATGLSWAGLCGYILSLVPILSWLPRYKWRDNLPSDVIAGLTVAIMHIPQGMAYAILAGVEPVTGIYTGMWPVLVYVMLGNMAHVSMGTFAIISIMVNQVVQNQGVSSAASPAPPLLLNVTQEAPASPLEIATAVSLSVGLIQVAIGLLRIGSLTAVVSDTIISSFTVGASVHVATSQIRHILGLDKVPGASGPGRIIMTYLGLGEKIVNTNLITLAISCACITFLVFCDSILSVKAKKFCSFPLPTQLVLMAVLTTISYFLGLKEEFKVKTISDIGKIPTGLPSPSISQLRLVPRVLGPSVPIAVVSIVISLGLGSMFGSKHGYKVPPNPECVAQGVSNIVGSFLLCLPMSASLSRSLVQERSGCRSLLTGLVSSLALLAVILSLGPLFEPLPVCVLASIILASLSGMFRKMTEVSKYFSRSFWDGLLWIVTFLATVLVDVDLGLMIGILFSFLIVTLRSALPQVTILARDAKSKVWVDRGMYDLIYDSKYLIIQIRGPVNFLTLSFLKSLIEVQMGKSRKLLSRTPKANKVTPVNVVKVELEEEEDQGLKGLRELKDADTSSWRTRRRSSKSSTDDSILKKDEDPLPGPGSLMSQLPWDVVLDLSHVTWLDDSGCSLVTWVARKHRLGGLVLPPHLEDVMEKWTGFQKIKCIIYPTLSDAIRLAVD